MGIRTATQRPADRSMAWHGRARAFNPSSFFHDENRQQYDRGEARKQPTEPTQKEKEGWEKEEERRGEGKSNTAAAAVAAITPSSFGSSLTTEAESGQQHFEVWRFSGGGKTADTVARMQFYKICFLGTPHQRYWGNQLVEYDFPKTQLIDQFYRIVS